MDLNSDGIGDGNNFAYGGARTNIYPFPFDGRSLLGQLQEYQSRGQPVDPQALYVVFGGANNVQDALRAAAEALALGQDQATVVAGALAAINQGATDIETILTTLGNQGATQFLVPNLPNVGLVPRIRELNNPALTQLGSLLGIAFNLEINQFLAGFDDSHSVARLDTFTLLQQRVGNPAAFGLTNVTDRCYTGDDITFTGGGTICANPDTFLFWDGIDPTARIHAELGLAALAAVPEPGAGLLLVACTVAFAMASRRRSGCRR